MCYPLFPTLELMIISILNQNEVALEPFSNDLRGYPKPVLIGQICHFCGSADSSHWQGNRCFLVYCKARKDVFPNQYFRTTDLHASFLMHLKRLKALVHNFSEPKETTSKIDQCIIRSSERFRIIHAFLPHIQKTLY